ncbi:alpha/beta fold hydrolase [Amycolatopsis sp. H20-H5]|uniref:alpha/beta fold hydrolase n=1 Tax=Amycolatopsis sp. H20-H5 TaxID=3046309 RepID=UPI002DBBC0ED|nr:alpha/beta hydrolase [Amycolatopsis sp. H20-H5]MEC3975909.1 alpha/beta hydrolase [Amycolatopsis sp. H20-H5]
MPIAPQLTPVRAELTVDGRRLSYLDFGGPGRPLLALHGHLDEGRTWSALAAALSPRWRVIAPDQRGHGDSDRAPGYTRDDYVADALALLDHLGVERVVALGHSGGGMTAYRLAARHPERVVAVVDEDGPVANHGDGPGPLSFVLDLPYEAPTRDALLAGLGQLAPMVAETVRENRDGTWRLPFHPRDTVVSEEHTRGEHWADWLGSDCPALLVLALRSQALPLEQGREMVARRTNTRLAELDTDHFVHTADPAGFAGAVREFLDTLDPA